MFLSETVFLLTRPATRQDRASYQVFTQVSSLLPVEDSLQWGWNENAIKWELEWNGNLMGVQWEWNGNGLGLQHFLVKTLLQYFYL